MGIWNTFGGSRSSSSSSGSSGIESESETFSVNARPAIPTELKSALPVMPLPVLPSETIMSDLPRDHEPIIGTEVAECKVHKETVLDGFNIVQNVFSHPCIVLRRQCQVNGISSSYHLTPFSLLPTIFNLRKRQGVACFWKGLGSSLSLLGLVIAVEEASAKVLSIPKEIKMCSTMKEVAQHLLMKGMALTITIPFISSSCIESVQSSMAHEKSGAFGFFKDGVSRLFSLNCGLQLPLWKLVLPIVGFELAHHFVSSLATDVVSASMKSKMEGDRDDDNYDDIQNYIYQKLVATISGSLMADTILFPFETILRRLIVQGTRTIIDNTDNGLEVVPTVTRYEGFLNCYSTIVEGEGFAGLYKGFGALLLQCGLCITILKLIKFVLSHLRENKKIV